MSRPRERMMLLGAEALSELELVALVLGGGKALERAFVVLEACGGLIGLDRVTAQELCRLPGVGQASAAALCAAAELGRRIGQLALPLGEPLRSSDDVHAYLRARHGTAEQEHFAVLGLDARRRVGLIRTVALGSVADVDVQPREVFRPLIRAGMCAAILVHNHPSGVADPSAADLELTAVMVEVGEVVGIPVVDHLVVTRSCVVSLFRERRV